MKLYRSIIYFFLILCFISCSDNKEEIKPTVGNVTVSVYASGIIKAENQYTVFSTVNGIIKKIKVKPGQIVKANQILFELESEKADLNTENARLLYQLSKENSKYTQDKISEMELKVQSAKDKMLLDESLFNRYKNIKKYNVISEFDFEKAETAYKNSKLNYEAAKKQLDQLKIQLITDYKRNSVNLKISEKTQKDFYIESAISGQVYDVLVEEGSLVTMQTPLAITGNSDTYILELEVDENDITQIQIEQLVLVTMDSYKNKVFEAKVSKIYPIMDKRSRTFRIECNFIKPPKKLFPNLSAEANIIIQNKKNVLTIPKSFLLDNEYVMLKNDEKRKVKIGLSDYEKVEIIEGLNKSESIYKPN